MTHSEKYCKGTVKSILKKEGEIDLEIEHL
jgi:hypothetical protein